MRSFELGIIFWTMNYKLRTDYTLSTLHFFWAFRRSRRAFRYIFARHVSVSLLKNRTSALRQAQ